MNAAFGEKTAGVVALPGLGTETGELILVIDREAADAMDVEMRCFDLC